MIAVGSAIATTTTANMGVEPAAGIPQFEHHTVGAAPPTVSVGGAPCSGEYCLAPTRAASPASPHDQQTLGSLAVGDIVNAIHPRMAR